MRPRVQVTDDTGVYFTDTLSWKTHIDYISKKMKSGVSVLYRLRNCAYRWLKLSVYRCLVESYLRYCLIIFGGAFYSHIGILHRLQKRSLRILAGSCNAPSDPLFRKFRLLTIRQLYLLKI